MVMMRVVRMSEIVMYVECFVSLYASGRGGVDDDLAQVVAAVVHVHAWRRCLNDTVAAAHAAWQFMQYLDEAGLACCTFV